MSRLGGMYGPDVTFLGVERCDLAQPKTLEGADVWAEGRNMGHRPTDPAGGPDLIGQLAFEEASDST